MNQLGNPEWSARPSEEVVDPRIQTHRTTEKTGALKRSLLPLAGRSTNDSTLNLRTLNFEKLFIL